MMRSKDFERQEVREKGRNELGDSRGFSILSMEMIKDVFLIEEKECTMKNRKD